VRRPIRAANRFRPNGFNRIASPGTQRRCGPLRQRHRGEHAGPVDSVCGVAFRRKIEKRPVRVDHDGGGPPPANQRDGVGRIAGRDNRQRRDAAPVHAVVVHGDDERRWWGRCLRPFAGRWRGSEMAASRSSGI
jgi:hypothetical protein